ncbi:MAG: hypothetical protein WD063_11440 [Pirellulales bacterium]
MTISPAVAQVLGWLGYGLYFAGPAALFLLASGRRARRDFNVFALGMATFLLAWISIDGLLGLLAWLGLAPDQPTLAHSLVFATLAGVFEESFRYAALGIVRRSVAVVDWRTVLVYAAGHSGGECMLCALERTKSAQLAPAALVADAVYHVLGAFIVQACFTAVVFRSIERKAIGFLIVAMVWHFWQDMPWTTALGSAGAAAGLAVSFGLYPCVLVWLLHRWYARKTPRIVVLPTARA